VRGNRNHGHISLLPSAVGEQRPEARHQRLTGKPLFKLE
jgi:hypothetical protein